MPAVVRRNFDALRSYFANPANQHEAAHSHGPSDAAGNRLGQSNAGYTEVEAGGFLRFWGSATYYLDEFAPLIGQPITSAAADITEDGAEGALTFSDGCTLADYVVMNAQINHDWQLGTALHPHLHWWQASASVPNWLLQYRWQKNGQAKTTTWTSVKYASHVFTYASGTLNQVTLWPEIAAPSGYSVSDIVQLRLLRDTANASTLFAGADPLTGDVSAVSYDYHKRCDTLGSRSAAAK